MLTYASIIVQIDEKACLPVDSPCPNLIGWVSVIEARNYRYPGELIKEQLGLRGWTQKVLAIVLEADATGINKLVAGKRPVDAEMALALSELFGIQPEVFLEIQKTYDLAQARIITKPDQGRINRAHLFGSLPIPEMVSRGWINVEDIRDVAQVERALTGFFEAQSVDEIEILPHAAKRTNVTGGVTPAQLAWIYRVHKIASEMPTPRYSPEALHAAIPKLKALLASAEEARKVPKILSECGIRFVLVESLPGAKIDGVCFWMPNGSPVIAMTMRYDRIDNFWFVLRHEIEHALRRHGQAHAAVMLDTELEGDRASASESIPEEERIANEAAAEFCVPQRSLEAFIARKSPFFAERDIQGFARTINVHPGLIAGQIQRRIKRYDRFRDHLVKIRSCVAPSAIVDGWGDIAPLDP